MEGFRSQETDSERIQNLNIFMVVPGQLGSSAAADARKEPSCSPALPDPTLSDFRLLTPGS